MPSPQVINFGADPYANAMGGFARNFLETLNQKTGQRRNEELFKNISDNYGKDANPEDLFRDVIKSEGLDQEFKRNKLNELKELAELTNKGKLNGYEAAKLTQRQNELATRNDSNDIARTRLENEAAKTEALGTKNKANLPKDINTYTSKILKDSGETLTPHDTADLNSFVEELVSDKENPTPLADAFKHAYDYIKARKDKIDEFQITPKPSFFTKGNLEENMRKAHEELKFLHDEDGITNQKTLRTIAAKGGWNQEEITQMLSDIFRSNGKGLRGPRSKISQQDAQTTAEIPFAKQGQVSEQAGIDNLLFGE